VAFMKKSHGGHKSNGFSLFPHAVRVGLHVGGGFYNVDGAASFVEKAVVVEAPL